MIQIVCSIFHLEEVPDEYSVFADINDESIFIKSFSTLSEAEKFLNEIMLVKIKGKKSQ